VTDSPKRPCALKAIAGRPPGQRDPGSCRAGGSPGRGGDVLGAQVRLVVDEGSLFGVALELTSSSTKLERHHGDPLATFGLHHQTAAARIRPTEPDPLQTAVGLSSRRSRVRFSSGASVKAPLRRGFCVHVVRVNHARALAAPLSERATTGHPCPWGSPRAAKPRQVRAAF
jgi:hypothetical protein